MKNKILLAIGILLALAVIIVIAILAGSGSLFQGAINNLRPIYTSCHIEGNTSSGEAYTSDNLADCENFQTKFVANPPFLKDGEYTVTANYVDPGLPKDNLIPLTVKNGQLACTYKESGYTPVVTITANTSNQNEVTASDNVNPNDEVPVGGLGVIAKVNYSKNNQTYAYDSNICESAFQATLYDANKVVLGTAKLDTNGFINSRPLVNELLLTNELYYTDKSGNTIKQFIPGNVYASVNAAPDLSFKFTIACSTNFPKVTIPSVVTDSDTTLLFQGVNEQFFNACGSKLYLSFQNTNRADDIQALNPIKLNPVDNNSVSYDLKLADLGSINQKDSKFPFIYTVNLHLRDSSDSTAVETLGTGVLTISDYTPIDYAAIANGTATSDSTTTTTTTDTSVKPGTTDTTPPPAAPPAPTTPVVTSDIIPATTDSTAETQTKPKVRRKPEAILTLPADTSGSRPVAAEVAPKDAPVDQP